MARPDFKWLIIKTGTATILRVHAQADGEPVAGAGESLITDPNTDDAPATGGPYEYDSGTDKVIARLDADVNAPEAEGYKDIAKAKISHHTEQLILNDSFEYPPASGNLFSLSTNAQMSWLMRASMINSVPPLLSMATQTTAQRTFRTKDDLGSYEFTTNASVHAALAASHAVIAGHGDSSRAAMDTIDAATTAAAIDAEVASYLAT